MVLWERSKGDVANRRQNSRYGCVVESGREDVLLTLLKRSGLYGLAFVRCSQFPFVVL